MSKQVDERVVSMQFDNKRFESNVQKTISTIDKLKQSLKLDGASKGLENIDAASKKVDMSTLSNGVETVRAKFSALQIMGVTALTNITNSAVNAGKRIASALTIEPIKAGFSEYETQMNAVQTILANTKSKGTTIDDVNGALDELNTYADKTIYNFTEMTRNIGTFTAAGVDLDTSVASIKGIANLAAVSGSTSQQASTAMYQLSQALSSGTVKLMDWNSVVNAGMGGQVFQDALKETAKVHGVNVDAMIEKEGSFRETLKNEWLTAEILTETLSKFTGDLDEAALKKMGYTEEQIKGIIDLGKTANDAATKVKTLTQLWDTLKEAAQSGWSQSWEIIVGDFEEAKELFTQVSDTIGAMIGASAESRNAVLQGWKDLGGRTAIIDAIRNAFEGIMSIIKPIGEAFREIFPPITAKQLTAFSEGLRNLTEKFKIGETTANNLKRTFKGVFALIDIGVQAIKALFGGVAQLIGFVAPAGEGILGFTANIGDFILKLRDAVKSTDVFGKIIQGIGKILAPIAAGIAFVGKTIIDTFKEISDKAGERFSPLTALGNGLMAVFVGLGKIIGRIMPPLLNLAKSVGSIFSNLMDEISSAIQDADYERVFDVINGGIFSAIGIFIAKFIKAGGDLLDNAGGFLDSFKEILSGVSDALGAFTQSLKAKALKEIATAIAILAASLLVLSLIDSEKLSSAIAALTILFAELIGAMSLMSKTTDGMNVFKISAIGGIMKKLATALLILAVAMKIISSMSWAELSVGLTGITVGLGALVGAVNLLPEKKVNSAAKAIKKLSTAMIIFAIALKIMGSMSWEEMGIGLISASVGLGIMVAAINLLPKDTFKRAAGLTGLATAMVILGAAFKIMATMSWEDMGKALTSMAGGLGLIVAAVNLLPKDAALKTLGMIGLATALVIMASALKIMGSMSWEEMGIALITLAGALTVITVAMSFMKSALPGAAALLIISAALTLLAPALKILGGMEISEIAKSLGMLAGVFVILGVAGYLLAPIVPAIIGLAGSITLLGVGILAAGVGVLAFAVGLTILAAALAASGGAITIFVSSIISLIPFLIEQIGVGIIRLCEVIAGSADAICKAIVAVVKALAKSIPEIVEDVLVLITTLLEILIDYLPQIVPLLVTLLSDLVYLIIDNLPTILDFVFDFLIALIDGVASKISELVDPIVNLFGAIFQTVAEVIAPIIEMVIGPILTIFKDLIVEVCEAIAPYIPDICDLFRDLSETVADAIVKIVEAIAPYIPNIQEIVTTIAGAINNIIYAFIYLVGQISPILGQIRGLIRDLGDVISNIFGGISDVIETTGEAIKTSLDGIAGVVEATGEAIKTGLEGVADVFDSAFGGISDVLDSVGGIIESVLGGIEGVIRSIGDAALNAGTGFEKFADGVETITNLSVGDIIASFGAIAQGIDDIKQTDTTIYDMFKSLERVHTAVKNLGSGDIIKPVANFGNAMKLTYEYIERVRDNFLLLIPTVQLGVQKIDTVATVVDKALNDVLKSFDGLSTNSGAIMNGISKSFSTFGAALTENMSSAVKQAGMTVTMSFMSLLDSMIQLMMSSVPQFYNSGTLLINALANGIKSGFTTVLLTCLVCFSSISSAATLYYTNLYNAGTYLVSGLASGIRDSKYLATAAAQEVANAVESIIRSAWKINSPSKVFYKIALGIPEGIKNAFGDSITGIKHSASDLAGVATNGFSNAIQKIADIVNSDIDSEPTIRPVLDLTDVRSGVDAISGMFAGRHSFVVDTSGSAAIAASMSKRQSENGELISAINKLAKSNNGKSGDTYQINGITYSDGTEVSDAIGTLVRAVKIERRV